MKEARAQPRGGSKGLRLPAALHVHPNFGDPMRRRLQSHFIPTLVGCWVHKYTTVLGVGYTNTAMASFTGAVYHWGVHHSMEGREC